MVVKKQVFFRRLCMRIESSFQRRPLTSSTNHEYHLFQHSITPAGELLMSCQDQGKRESPRPSLKKNGWVSQRFKPFPVELTSVDVKQEKKRDKPKLNKNLTIDDLPKIREKASIKKASCCMLTSSKPPKVAQVERWLISSSGFSPTRPLSRGEPWEQDCSLIRQARGRV